jgi:ABC-2 type transport system ATP-binding protein
MRGRRSDRDQMAEAIRKTQKRAADLAKAMLNQPHLLLLDEPTASLDLSAVREIWARIRDLALSGGVGVL